MAGQASFFESGIRLGKDWAVDNPRCGICGGKTKRNGSTSAGRQRFRCTSCGASSVRRNDARAKSLARFLDWLLSKDSIGESGESRSTFWRRTSWVWEIWPVAPVTGEVHDVVHVDGIWLGHAAVVLIAVAGPHVIGWHVARSESAEAWSALLARIPEPTLAVSDGSGGFARAARIIWPGARVQRCTVHVARRVKEFTTLSPKLEAGRELLGLANALLKVRDADGAALWLASYAGWCAKWDGFLRESTVRDGRRQYVHEPLRRARRSLNAVIKDGTLFTFVELAQERGGIWPSTNNAIESVNARIREMLRLHRGMPMEHRIRAIMWWCYMHTERPLPPAGILRAMPTDGEIKAIRRRASRTTSERGVGPNRYDKGIDWSEFHMLWGYRSE